VSSEVATYGVIEICILLSSITDVHIERVRGLCQKWTDVDVGSGEGYLSGVDKANNSTDLHIFITLLIICIPNTMR